jgi:hypothetical protein
MRENPKTEGRHETGSRPQALLAERGQDVQIRFS